MKRDGWTPSFPHHPGALWLVTMATSLQVCLLEVLVFQSELPNPH